MTLTCSSAQTVPVITSPANNTVVHKRDIITVIVSVPSALSPIQVDVGLNDPQAPLLALSSPPYNFTYSVQSSSFGPKELTAMAITGPGTGAFSSPITLDIEPQSSLVALTISPGTIGFFFVCEPPSLCVRYF